MISVATHLTQLTEDKRLQELLNAQYLATTDPYHLVRQQYPQFAELDFPAEAELIAKKQSKLSAHDRALVAMYVKHVTAAKFAEDSQ